jgi:hypothetical protein
MQWNRQRRKWRPRLCISSVSRKAKHEAFLSQSFSAFFVSFMQFAYCDLVGLSQDLIDSVLVLPFGYNDHQKSEAIEKLFRSDVFVRALAKLA